MPSDLPKTCFRMERLQKITKTRGVDKYANILKHGAEMKQKRMKTGPGSQTKRMLKNKCQQNKQISTNDAQIGPKRWGYFGGGASWGTFGRPNWASKVVPHRFQSTFPMIEKSTKNDTEEHPHCEKELPNSSFFGIWPGGLPPQNAYLKKRSCAVLHM